MQSESSSERRRTLPIILIAAVVQGWSLYALHMSITHKHWPATDPAWLTALYALATLIPIAVQMLAGAARQRLTWSIIGAMSVVYFYFGWHHGTHILDIAEGRHDWDEQWFPFVAVSIVLWLLMLPFIQARIETGRWRAPYSALFTNAWNNKLVLAEAALFTGLFWLLLGLMQQLFFMLGVPFFRELFQEPVFVYPVTSIAFGIALHLIGSIERLTTTILDQILNVLKWLALLSGVILTLFTLALLVKLPGMIASGDRAISAAWLLWLIAVTVLLVNAAYRDGGVERPYPRVIAFALRLVIPLTVIIAITALYAMYLRIDRYGFTVDRVWACVVAAAACIYSVGYAFAARGKQPWMGGIARVNVIVALFLMAVLALTLTPVLSPYRIAASSQFAQVIKRWPAELSRNRDDPMRYLRFETGDYGRTRLTALANLSDHPEAKAIRADAKNALASEFSWTTPTPPTQTAETLRKMQIHPRMRTLEPKLAAALEAEISKPQNQWMYINADHPPLGVFIDMDGNQTEEFVLVANEAAVVFEQQETQWALVSRLRSRPGSSELKAKDEDWDNAQAIAPRWRDLKVGQRTYWIYPFEY